ncbi:MAG: M20/M25/M40 family metallo-hydrolase [Tenericutes bacterium]|nr:M20/M25/M40 family metallo-hydrolase [Mycoplasmatota bacterium]
MIVLYIILGLIAALLLAAFVNTIIIKDRSKLELPLEDDPIEREIFANEFSRMIQIDTISYQKELDNIGKFKELHKVMEELFPNVFRIMDRKVFDGGSLLFKWTGKSDAKPMVLMAHQDVVPANADDWEFEPFSGKVTDTEIYGRGTLDTKSTLYAFFKACDELIRDGFVPEQDIYISSATDEEISGDGALKSVEYLKKNGVKPYIVLDEGGAIVSDSLPSVKTPMAMIGVIEKGYCNIRLTARSKGGHSSTPPKNSPIARLAAFITECEKNFPMKTKMLPEVADIFKKAAPRMSFGYRFLFGNFWLFKPLITALLPMLNSYGRALLSTTIAFTMCKGSNAENVIPSEAYVIANLRTQPFQDVDESFEVMKKLAAKFDIEALITERRDSSPISSTSNAAYKYLLEIIAKNYPDAVASPYIMLGGTDCRFFSEITESAFRFSPVRLNNKELSKMHGKNESIKKTALTEAKRFYKDFIVQHK